MDRDRMRREFEEAYAADAMPLEGDWFRRSVSIAAVQAAAHTHFTSGVKIQVDLRVVVIRFDKLVRVVCRCIFAVFVMAAVIR